MRANQDQGVGGMFSQLASNASTQVEASALLGHLFMWELSCNRISHPALETLASVHGFPSEYLPSEVSATGAFRRAWRMLANRVGEGLLLREIGENDDAICVALARESTTMIARSWQGDQLATIVFDKTAKTTTIEIDPTHASDVPANFETTLRRAIAYHSEHTTGDIRKMIVNFVGTKGVKVKDGAYFIPQAHGAKLDALCQVVEECSKSNVNYPLPIADSAKARQTMSRAAKDGLAEEIRQLEEQIARFDLGSAREGTLEGKLDVFNEMRARVATFASVLNLKADDLNMRLDQLRARISHVLNGGDPESAPEVTPAAKPAIEAFDAEAGF